MRNKTILIVGVAALLVIAAGIVLYSKVVSDCPDADAPMTTKQIDNTRGLRFCEVFLIGGNAITKDLKASCYNTTGLNYDVSKDPLNSCPDELVNRLQMDKYKKDYKVLATYLNKQRFWVFDSFKVPTGPMKDFDGLKGYFMGLGIIPKDADVSKPGWLTYRKSPVHKKTELTFSKGKPIFIIDDENGKPWVMKAYRDSYGQNLENLHTLGQRYQKLPAGWKFRVVVLDRDLVIAPGKADVISQIFQDEFENTFDYVGDGSSNFQP